MTNNPTAIDLAKKLLELRSRAMALGENYADKEVSAAWSAYNDSIDHAPTIAQALLDCEARCEALGAALAFYAEEHNYKHAAEPSWDTSTAPPTMHYPLGYPRTTVSTDGGKKAREALTPQPALDKDARIAELDILEEILNSDMAMREEDEGNVSPLLEKIRSLVKKMKGERLWVK